MIDKADGDTDEGEEILDPKPFLKLVGKVRKLHETQEQYRRELKRARLSKQRQALLNSEAIPANGANLCGDEGPSPFIEPG